MTTVTDYWDYMQRKTQPVGKAPELAAGFKGPFYNVHDVVDWKGSPEVEGAYYSNSGIEVRPATEEEINFLAIQFAAASRVNWP